MTQERGMPEKSSEIMRRFFYKKYSAGKKQLGAS